MSTLSKPIRMLEEVCDLQVILFACETTLMSQLTPLANPIKNQLSSVLTSSVLSTPKSSYSIHTLGHHAAKELLFVFTGEAPSVSLNTLRHIGGTVSRLAISKKIATVSWLNCDVYFPHLSPHDIGLALSEGIHLGSYVFDTYKSKKDARITVTHSMDTQSNGSELGKTLGIAGNHARNFANMPGNALYPEAYAKKITELFSGTCVKVTVLSGKKLSSLGMTGLLVVGQGSTHAPCMVVLEYTAELTPPIALVGKGITFDSGGISIKPSKGMSSMKGDMSGSAAVVGAFLALQSIKPKQSVIGVIPLAENLPSSKAQRPGDIITAMNGTTIEIINTDAEGRVVLADALCYAQTKKPSLIVDIATLTGAASVSLGNESAAILGNTQSVIDAYVSRCPLTGEQLWQLPLFEAFSDYIKSDVADIMNAAEGKGGGTSTAAQFLSHFVGKTPWIHIDMAPVMSHSSTSGSEVKGMSGFGVRTLVHGIMSA